MVGGVQVKAATFEQTRISGEVEELAENLCSRYLAVCSCLYLAVCTCLYLAVCTCNASMQQLSGALVCYRHAACVLQGRLISACYRVDCACCRVDSLEKTLNQLAAMSTSPSRPNGSGSQSPMSPVPMSPEQSSPSPKKSVNGITIPPLKQRPTNAKSDDPILVRLRDSGAVLVLS